MSPQLNESASSPIKQQIISLEQKYQMAFKADATFQVLKEIRETIKRLKAELGEQLKN
ncbi:MAG: hypothetical protein ACR2KZ_05700 [Segetibacter sp.]